MSAPNWLVLNNYYTNTSRISAGLVAHQMTLVLVKLLNPLFGLPRSFTVFFF